MRLSYFLNGKKFAARDREHIPRLGDFVRFNSVIYKIKSVYWFEDEPNPRVGFDIVEDK